MKKLLFFVLFVILILSCDNSSKGGTAASQQYDKIMVSRVETFNLSLPKQNGALETEDCMYDGKNVVLKLRIVMEFTSTDILKWLPSMMLNDIHLLDTVMIKRLVELNQPLTYEVYDKNGKVQLTRFQLTPKKLKARANYMKMF